MLSHPPGNWDETTLSPRYSRTLMMAPMTQRLGEIVI